MINMPGFIDKLKNYRKNLDFVKFKHTYFQSFISVFGFLIFLGNFVWVFKDLFIIGADARLFLLDLALRSSPILFYGYMCYLNKKKNSKGVFTILFLEIWWSIILTMLIDSIIPMANGLTGDGWISFYFFFFILALVSTNQTPIYISYVLYSILIYLSDKDVWRFGFIEYEIPIIRPLTTDMIIVIGLVFVSIVFRTIFVDLYENEKRLLVYSKKDALTDCWNRHVLDDISDEQFNFKDEHTLFLMDVDNFKSLNDTYGHNTGDKVLVNVASAIKKAARGTDLVIRYGGDEFLLLLQGAEIDIQTVFVRITQALQPDMQKYGISLSIGTYHARKDDLSIHSAIKKADQALYYSKNNGKNQVNEYENLTFDS